MVRHSLPRARPPNNLLTLLFRIVGKFSIRLVPDLTPDDVNELVQKYLNEEFAKLGSKNTFKVEMLSGGMPWVASIDHWNFRA